MKKASLILIIIAFGYNVYGDDPDSSIPASTQTQPASGIIYSNPRVYNVDYTFEMFPDPNKIDRTKDLKVWIPMPREWDSQKAVKIISVQPEPQARYVDPDYGNSIYYWDFGTMPQQPAYRVKMAFRLESYEVNVKVDPNRVGPYDKTSREYKLYTRTTRTIHITPRIRELAREAIGDEKNPYLQAQRIDKFVGGKMHFKVLDYERGRGIDVLLAYPVTDEKTGQEHYEGCCNQYSAFMVALCRATGIPARCVHGYIHWNPWVDPNNIKAAYPFETKLSPNGLAAIQLYGGLGAHTWAELLIPGYGWIPADALWLPEFGYQSNGRWITSKGRDILLGPGAPPEDGEGYGSQWVALHAGRADTLFNAVVNIAKIHEIKVTLLHHSDPFPADGLASYPQNPLSLKSRAENARHWRQGILGWPSRYKRNHILENLNLSQLYKDHPRARQDREAFVCHMLRRQMGNAEFSKLVNSYLTLRQKSGEAVPTGRFEELAENVYGKPLRWFFNQWVNSTDLPRLKLENVTAVKDNEDWHVKGRLLQTGHKAFRLPLEIALDTKNGREKHKLWIERKATDFGFHTHYEPRTFVVDPDYEVLKIQEMPPRLFWFWDVYPKLIVVYGTLAEVEANKKAAEFFNDNELGLDNKIIKADTDVNDNDLKTNCVFLIGRPQTNRVAQRFKDSFPIKFDGVRFAWKGTTYNKPTEGVAQVIESPLDHKKLMIMYAGLSTQAIQEFFEQYLDDAGDSYVIYDGDEQILTGDWEDMDSNLYWNFDTNTSVRSQPKQK